MMPRAGFQLANLAKTVAQRRGPQIAKRATKAAKDVGLDILQTFAEREFNEKANTQAATGKPNIGGLIVAGFDALMRNNAASQTPESASVTRIKQAVAYVNAAGYNGAPPDKCGPLTSQQIQSLSNHFALEALVFDKEYSEGLKTLGFHGGLTEPADPQSIDELIAQLQAPEVNAGIDYSVLASFFDDQDMAPVNSTGPKPAPAELPAFQNKKNEGSSPTKEPAQTAEAAPKKPKL